MLLSIGSEIPKSEIPPREPVLSLLTLRLSGTDFEDTLDVFDAFDAFEPKLLILFGYVALAGRAAAEGIAPWIVLVESARSSLNASIRNSKLRFSSSTPFNSSHLFLRSFNSILATRHRSSVCSSFIPISTSVTRRVLSTEVFPATSSFTLRLNFVSQSANSLRNALFSVESFLNFAAWLVVEVASV